MDQFTSEVARVLRDDELPRVVPESVLSDVRRVAARRRRLQATGALGAAAIAVAAVTVGVLLGAGAGVEPGPVGPPPGPTPAPTLVPTDGAVPWSDRTDYGHWEPPAPQPRETTTPCTADDLRVHDVSSEGATQHIFRWVTLLKRTPGRCTLAGYPGLVGTGSDGRRQEVPLQQDQRPTGSFQETPATIEVHETTQVTITTSSACTAGASYPHTYRDIELVLGDGSSIELGENLKSACVPTITRFYRDNTPIEEPVRWDGLQAELRLPESVRAGRSLVYEVTLHNTGGEDLDLSPCGGYRQSLTGTDMNGNQLWKGIQAEYRLNCDSAPVLPAGASRSYVMELQVPQDAPALDEVLVRWRLLDTSPDQSGQGYVEVTH